MVMMMKRYQWKIIIIITIIIMTDDDDDNRYSAFSFAIKLNIFTLFFSSIITVK